MKDREDHDAVPVHLAEGWIGICATCGWIGSGHEAKGDADAECRRHGELAATVDSPAR